MRLAPTGMQETFFRNRKHDMAQTELIIAPLKMIFSLAFSYQRVILLFLPHCWFFSSWPHPICSTTKSYGFYHHLLISTSASHLSSSPQYHWPASQLHPSKWPPWLQFCPSLIWSPHCCQYGLSRICICSCHFSVENPTIVSRCLRVKFKFLGVAYTVL